ncbi:MAG: metallophosphoesterase [Lachnospiraceae bacterium]
MLKEKTRLSKFIISSALAASIMITIADGVKAETIRTTFEPQDIILTIGSDSSSLSLCWYNEDNGTIETPSVKVDGISTTFTGSQGTATSGKEYNKVTITGLKPSKTYSCQVSSDGDNYSDTYTFETTDNGKYTFAVVGDPQIYAKNLQSDANAWNTTVTEILSKDVSFIAGTGDQVNDVSELEYGAFTSGLLQDSLLVPFATCIGNHEGSAAGRAMFDYHYNISMLTGDTVGNIELVNYYYVYNNTLFVVLDDAAYPADETAAAPFIAAYDKTLSEAVTMYAGKYDWLIVNAHKSQQSDAAHYNDSDIKAYSLAGFEDLMTDYNVDLVLTGHDHSYVRTYPFTSNGGPLVEDGIVIDQNNLGNELLNPAGTVYMCLNSATGSKYYGLQTEYKYTSAVENQDTIPEYTIITAKNSFLSVTTYEVGVSDPIDSFTIQKNSSTNAKANK